MLRADSKPEVGLRLTPCAGSLGALVTEVDLLKPLSDAERDQLLAAFVEHQVLFFRDQPLAPEDHRRLASIFGPPVLHGAYAHVDGFEELTILEVDPSAPPKIDTWHTDMTFMAEPPLGSVLRATVVPEKGGDTLFASAGRAYDTLSPAMQRYLEGLTAMHAFAQGFKESLAEPGGYERLKPMLDQHPPTEHPVIRVHPVSGRKTIFVNPLFTTHIVGVPAKESAAILAFLYEHVVTPEHTVRFAWAPGSIAIWDNRAVYHRPVNDFWPAHRRMERITIAGDRPRGPSPR